MRYHDVAKINPSPIDILIKNIRDLPDDVFYKLVDIAFGEYSGIKTKTFTERSFVPTRLIHFQIDSIIRKLEVQNLGI